jgi:hypothetical protein
MEMGPERRVCGDGSGRGPVVPYKGRRVV